MNRLFVIQEIFPNVVHSSNDSRLFNFRMCSSFWKRGKTIDLGTKHHESQYRLVDATFLLVKSILCSRIITSLELQTMGLIHG